MAFVRSTGETERAVITPGLIAQLSERVRKGGESAPKRLVVIDLKQPGLRLVVGRRSARWELAYRPRGLGADGQRHPMTTITLGQPALMSPAEARAEAAAIRAQSTEGRDIAAERRRLKAAVRAAKKHAYDVENRQQQQLVAILDASKSGSKVALDFSTLSIATLGQCVQAYLRYGARGNETTLRDVKLHLKHALLEMEAGDLKPSELKQSRISAMVRLHDGKPATARHRLGNVSRLFKWLVANEAVSQNPALNLRPPAPPQPRTRVYTAAEVQALWSAAEKLHDSRADLFKLLLLLPFRRQNLADLLCSGVHQNGKRMELVVSKSKNGLEHRVPLVGTARHIVEKYIKDNDQKASRLLPLVSDGKRFNAWGRFVKAIRRESGVADFNFHDFRRLFLTECAEHQIGDFSTVDGLLNHAGSLSKPGASRAYDHAQRTDARISVLEAWDKIVGHAVGSGAWPREMKKAGNVVRGQFKGAK